ncbi:hypothetical protein C0993_011164 [Termitomyces sp. T159_Od127]|nr:hypothetical protein C0993_011164 [Termitomyces sp. T159_Od127]
MKLDDAPKSSGWLEGERWDLVKHSSTGTVMEPPEGKARTHSPPEATMRRSRMAGPKNQAVKVNHMVVYGGLVIHERKNAAVVHPHAFLMK